MYASAFGLSEERLGHNSLWDNTPCGSSDLQKSHFIQEVCVAGRGGLGIAIQETQVWLTLMRHSEKGRERGGFHPVSGKKDL